VRNGLQAGLLTSRSNAAAAPSRAKCSVAGLGQRCYFRVTVAGPRRILTGFPFLLTRAAYSEVTAVIWGWDYACRE
jgi:hypothetical protein